MRVGILCDYFLAESDEEAAWTIDRGPNTAEVRDGWLLRGLEPVTPVSVPGLEPVDMLASLEFLMTGQAVGSVLVVDSSSGGGRRAERWVFRVSREVHVALADADDASLGDVAVSWSATAEMRRGSVEVLTGVLVRLAELARCGRETETDMYCWMSL